MRLAPKRVAQSGKVESTLEKISNRLSKMPIGHCAKPKRKGGDSGSWEVTRVCAFMHFPLNWPACTLKIVRALRNASSGPLNSEIEHDDGSSVKT